MSWIVVLPLALAAFALAVLAFRLERRLWTTLLAALVFGLAGYALQARPDLAGDPRLPPAGGGQGQWASVEARQEMVPARFRSGSNRLLTADAFSRRGQFANAAALLRGEVDANPRDSEAWLAMGNALVEHAEGALTPAALYAYRRADALAPASPAPGYFLGLALIRQGRFPEARQIWAATLEQASEPSAARALLEQRLARLDALLATAAASAKGAPGAAQQNP